MTMTVKLPEKAGFVATTAEWDQLVRIAENLAAQVVQAQASAVETARIVGAERDAARAEVARLTADVDRMADMLRVCECGHHAVAHEGRRFFCNMKGCDCEALRQPAHE